MADLKLKNLSFRNFKNFVGSHELDLDIKPGLYHVSGLNKRAPELGPNGVGKSSIWDALIWCLTAKTGRDNKPGAAIVPWSGEKEVYACAEFERDGNQYTLERTRNPNSLHLWKIGTPHDEERELTQDDVPAIIGMTEETFRRTVVISQTEKLFLDLKPEAQAAMFSDALSLNVYLDASERAKKAQKIAAESVQEFVSAIDYAREKIVDLKGEISAARARSDEFIDECVTKSEELTTQLAATQKELKALRKTLPDEPKIDAASNERSEELLELIKALPDEFIDAKNRLARKYKSKTCSKCGQPVKNDEYQEALEKITKENDDKNTELHAELMDIQKERREFNLGFQKELDAYRSIEREISMLEHREKMLHLALKQIDNQENTALNDVQRLRKKLKATRVERDELKAELAEAEKLVEVAEYWSKAFREIRLAIIDDVLTEMEVASNRHAVNLGLTGWRIQFETEREAKSGNVSYSFTVFLYPPDQDKPIKWESYSGGESQRWQLATTFALSEVLLSRAGVSPSLEVLDEPTKGLSPEGISDLLEHLRTRAIELERAIFIVDHHALDRGSFDGILRVTATRKGSKLKWL